MKQNRRKTASFLLLWLLLSGQMFCTAHAGFGIENPEVTLPCCHGSASTDSQPQAENSCCENPASFCCGEGKQGASATPDIDFSQPTLFLIATFDEWLDDNVLEALPSFPLWTEDIYLRRSDPPIHLVNCTFLD